MVEGGGGRGGGEEGKGEGGEEWRGEEGGGRRGRGEGRGKFCKRTDELSERKPSDNRNLC